MRRSVPGSHRSALRAVLPVFACRALVGFEHALVPGRPWRDGAPPGTPPVSLASEAGSDTGGKRSNHAACGPNSPVLTELWVTRLCADTVDPWPLRFSGRGRPPSTSVESGIRAAGPKTAQRPIGRRSILQYRPSGRVTSGLGLPFNAARKGTRSNVLTGTAGPKRPNWWSFTG